MADEPNKKKRRSKRALKDDGILPKSVSEEFDMANAAMRPNTDTGENDSLIDFKTIEKNLTIKNQSYIGVHPIPVKDIVGSLGRYDNFNAQFLPKDWHDRGKAAGVRSMNELETDFPPIKVYQVHDKYFVVDGHHRVMVSVERKREYIDAEVTRVEYDVDLASGREFSAMTVITRKLLISIEAEAFARETGLYDDMLRHPLAVTELSSYAKLFEYITELANYRRSQGIEEPLAMAAFAWYRKSFLPAAEVIVAEHVLDRFPGRTVADLYVWMRIHQGYLSETGETDVGFTETKDDFVKKFGQDYMTGVLPELMMNFVRVAVKSVRNVLPEA